MLNAIRDFRPTYFPAVPTIYVSLLSHRASREFGSRPKCGSSTTGGAPCPVDVIERVRAHAPGGTLYEGYGLSESIAGHAHHATARAGASPARSASVSGYRHEDRRHRDRHGRCRPARPGELCISGPQVMRGYWNQPEETAGRCARTRTAEWLHTGDIARWTRRVHTIVQRKKDLIIVDGVQRVSVGDRGRALRAPGSPARGRIGVPDNYHGEVVRGVYRLRDRVLRRRLKNDRPLPEPLAPYKVPRQVEIRGRTADERRRQDAVPRPP